MGSQPVCSSFAGQGREVKHRESCILYLFYWRTQKGETQARESVLFCRTTEKGVTQGVSVYVPVLQGN